MATGLFLTRLLLVFPKFVKCNIWFWNLHLTGCWKVVVSGRRAVNSGKGALVTKSFCYLYIVSYISWKTFSSFVENFYLLEFVTSRNIFLPRKKSIFRVCFFNVLRIPSVSVHLTLSLGILDMWLPSKFGSHTWLTVRFGGHRHSGSGDIMLLSSGLGVMTLSLPAWLGSFESTLLDVPACQIWWSKVLWKLRYQFLYQFSHE